MADIVLTEEAGFGMATVLALGDAVCDVPGVTMLPTGPGLSLAYAPEGSPGWAEGLAERLAGRAHVVDQSGAYGLFVVSGADASRLVQKGMPVDLDPVAFPPGRVAVGAIAHLGVVVHHEGPGRFHIFVYRSFMASFRHWLEQARAGF